MMSSFDSSNSESDGEFEDMFRIVESDDEIFFFEDMNILQSDDKKETEVTFTYSMSNGIVFKSKLAINICFLSGQFDAFLFSIGMCALTWYWMGFATTKIVIKTNVYKNFILDNDMIAFWQTFYRNVLLEFVYLNRMTKANITVQLESTTNCKSVQSQPTQQLSNNENIVLLPLGGGKDSLVAWHLAKECGMQPHLMYVADGMFEYQCSWRLQEIVKVADCPFQLVRHDFHDDNFLKYCRSYLQPCGHPWAALVLFDAALISGLKGISTISLGFERSADEGNGVVIDGVEVNHQYDKSSSFVTLASAYIRRYLSPSLRVFSPLKDMWELEITRIFCQEPDLLPFHPLFMSCNSPLENNTVWCAKCEKCAFMFLLLSAWLDSDFVVNTIFHGVNMLCEESLLDTFMALIGCNGAKPFDCVGTADEAKAALHLTAIRYTNELLKKRELLESNGNIQSANTNSCSNNGNSDSNGDYSHISLPPMLCKLCRAADIELLSDTSDSSILTTTTVDADITNEGVVGGETAVYVGYHPKIIDYNAIKSRWGLL